MDLTGFTLFIIFATIEAYLHSIAGWFLLFWPRPALREERGGARGSDIESKVLRQASKLGMEAHLILNIWQRDQKNSD